MTTAQRASGAATFDISLKGTIVWPAVDMNASNPGDDRSQAPRWRGNTVSGCEDAQLIAVGNRAVCRRYIDDLLYAKTYAASICRY